MTDLSTNCKTDASSDIYFFIQANKRYSNNRIKKVAATNNNITVFLLNKNIKGSIGNILIVTRAFGRFIINE